jgi:lipopolysaccharide export system protein LptC
MVSAAEQASDRRRPGPIRTGGRSNDAFAGALRHSRRVRFFKIALPLVAGVIAMGFAGYSWLLSPAGISIDLDATAIRDGKLVMANPRMSGFTKDNLPYALNAARAIQDLSRTGGIALEEIDAKFPIAADKWAQVRADSGVYDDAGNTLAITSPVTFRTSDGLTARLRSAQVDIAAGELKTSDPVRIEQEGAVITADSLDVRDKGKVFVFENRVRMTLDPSLLRTAQAGE